MSAQYTINKKYSNEHIVSNIRFSCHNDNIDNIFINSTNSKESIVSIMNPIKRSNFKSINRISYNDYIKFIVSEKLKKHTSILKRVNLYV